MATLKELNLKIFYRIPDLQFDLFSIYSDHPGAKLHTCTQDELEATVSNI